MIYITSHHIPSYHIVSCFRSWLHIFFFTIPGEIISMSLNSGSGSSVTSATSHHIPSHHITTHHVAPVHNDLIAQTLEHVSILLLLFQVFPGLRNVLKMCKNTCSAPSLTRQRKTSPYVPNFKGTINIGMIVWE